MIEGKMWEVKVIVYYPIFADSFRDRANMNIDVWEDGWKRCNKGSQYSFERVMPKIRDYRELENCFKKFVKDYQNKTTTLLIPDISCINKDIRKAYIEVSSSRQYFGQIFLLQFSCYKNVHDLKCNLDSFFKVRKYAETRDTYNYMKKHTDKEYRQAMIYLRSVDHLTQDGKKRPPTAEQLLKKCGIRRSTLDKYCKREFGATFSNCSNKDLGIENEPDVEIDVDIY